ncbi:extracellular solute-binding protein [Halalkalibacter sp. AB-rgal2]|uniref:sugar ABC transporter substrate-binding protein n=1 Tax=Halalkalibacter sp. AB-rgal2 TaxID=3242695 RepID=UPI00359D7ABF
MEKLKVKWSFLIVISSLVLVLAACGEPDRDGANESDLEEGQGEEKPNELVVWINDEDIAEDVAKEMFDKYTEETGIEIVFNRVAIPDQVQDLSLAGPSGNGPDVFFQPHDSLGDIVAQGLALPMDYSADEMNQFSDVAIDAFTYDDEIYGAPVAVETYFAYYNKSIMEEPPATIEDVFEFSKEYTDTSQDQYGFLVAPEFYYLYSFINSHGGYVFGEEDGVYDPTDIGLNNEGAVAGLTQYKEFIDEGILPRTLTVDVMDGLFSEGKVGMVISGPWNLPIYEAALGEDLATAPLPQMNGEVAPSFVGVKSWLVSYYSEHPEWAEDLAKFLTNDENSQYYYEVTGEIPPRPEILDDITDPLYAGYAEQIEFGTPMPNIPAMSAVWDMDDAIEMINNGEDVAEVLDEIVEDIKAKIEVSGQ